MGMGRQIILVPLV